MNLQSKQENKARQNFRKTYLTPWYPHVRMRIRGREMFVFWDIWWCAFSCYLCLEIRPFALLPTNFTLSEILLRPFPNIFQLAFEFGFLRIVAIIYLLLQWTKTGVFMDLPQILLLMLSRFKRVNYLILFPLKCQEVSGFLIYFRRNIS